MIKISNLHAYYGTIEALKGINLEIRKGKITCLIGSNGAGKTTLLKSISGACNRTGGSSIRGTISRTSPPRRWQSLGLPTSRRGAMCSRA